MRIATLIILSILMISCNSFDKEKSFSILTILSIKSPDVSEDETGTDFINCDVLDANQTISDNMAVITLQAQLTNPNDIPSFYNDVFIDQIDVEYFRSDGASVEGIDIPRKFSLRVGALVKAVVPKDSSDSGGSSTSTTTDTTSVSFTIMRAMAKTEPPLVNLVHTGRILYLNAKVTVWGKDLAGDRVRPAVGYIQIQCADFIESDT